MSTRITRSLDSLREKRERITKADIGWNFGKYIFILLFLAVVVLPMIYVISVSFRSGSELFTQEVYLIPKNPTLESWTSGLEEIGPNLINSTLVAAGTVVLSLLITVPGAYVFGRKEFPGKRIIFYVVILSLLFPHILLTVPIAVTWREIDLFNTVPGLWLAYQAFVAPYAMWILRDFFASLPKNIEEAAQIYGCTQFRAFLRVVLPLAKPGIVAVGFLAFLVGWKDLLFAAMLTTGNGPRTAVVSLFLSIFTLETTRWGVLMAESLIIGLPPFVLYFVSRRYLSEAFAM